LFFKAIQDVQTGKDAPHVIRKPAANRLSHIVVLSEIIESPEWHDHLDKRIKDQVSAA
jgi:hypothetical protein